MYLTAQSTANLYKKTNKRKMQKKHFLHIAN